MHCVDGAEGGLVGDAAVEECARRAGPIRPVAEGSLGAGALGVGLLECVLFRVHGRFEWRVEEAVGDAEVVANLEKNCIMQG